MLNASERNKAFHDKEAIDREIWINQLKHHRGYRMFSVFRARNNPPNEKTKKKSVDIMETYQYDYYDGNNIVSVNNVAISIKLEVENEIAFFTPNALREFADQLKEFADQVDKNSCNIRTIKEK